MNNAELQTGTEVCYNFEWEHQKDRKIVQKTFLPVFLQREIAGTFCFACVLPTCCVLDQAHNVAPKQLQI